jgi:membrane peptidoglycan carboxypeptidase
MATFAAGGQRAQAHFVREVRQGDDVVYTEPLARTALGLNPDQLTMLDYTLHKVSTSNFANDWDAAGKTGTWQAGDSTTKNAHTWMVGYTHALAAAVWVGTTDGTALVTKDGSTEVYGSNYPGPIWQQFMRDATNAMQLDKKFSKFAQPKLTGSPTQSASAEPSPSPSPTGTPKPTLAPSLPPILPSPILPSPTPTGGGGGGGTSPSPSGGGGGITVPPVLPEQSPNPG